MELTKIDQCTDKGYLVYISQVRNLEIVFNVVT